MKTTHKLLNLLATAVIGLTLVSCGGGGGGGGGGDNGGGNGGNNNGGNNTVVDYAPASLEGFNFKTSTTPSYQTLSFKAGGCTYSDGHGITYSGTYTYRKSGINEGELYFDLVGSMYSSTFAFRTKGTVTCSFNSSLRMMIDGSAETRMINGSGPNANWSNRNISGPWYKQ